MKIERLFKRNLFFFYFFAVFFLSCSFGGEKKQYYVVSAQKSGTHLIQKIVKELTDEFYYLIHPKDVIIDPNLKGFFNPESIKIINLRDPRDILTSLVF